MSILNPPKLTKRRLIAGAAVLALLGAGAYATRAHWRDKKADLSQYQIAKAQRMDLEDLVTATGSLQPRDYVDVGAQVSGQLKKIHVEIGSVVQAGDLLAEIDPTVYRANVDARRAQLKNLQATLMERQSQLVLAQQQLTRQSGLISGDATTQELVQQAEASVRSAQAQIAALQAQIEQSESTLKADEANLNYANIYSPMSGVVVSITARQGQTINATQQAPTILRVADLSTMTVQTQVSEADIGQMRADMDAYFTTLGNRGRRWWGKLRKVEPTPTVTNNVVLYNALFDVANEQRNLLPQMTAQVFFVASRVENALVVPASAVTIQRGEREPGGGRNGFNGPNGPNGPNGQSGAGGPRGQASVSSSVTAGASATASSAHKGQPSARQDAVSESGPSPRRRAQEDAPRPDRAGNPGGAGAPSAKGAAPVEAKPGAIKDADLAQMSREDRRALFERLSPEERDALRERMRAMRERREAASPNSAPREPDSRPAARTPSTVWAGVGQGRQTRPRDGVVKVVTEAGAIEERKVKVGISNRVQVQILEGLNEGDQVVAGVKPPPGQQRNDGAGRNALQQGQGGMPGGPGGMGGAQGGMGGGGRGR